MLMALSVVLTKDAAAQQEDDCGQAQVGDLWSICTSVSQALCEMDRGASVPSPETHILGLPSQGV